MITVAEALDVLRGACAAGAAERVPLADAAGRFLARAIASDVDWPPFDTSAMDGYAVRLADLGAPGASLAERPGLVAAGDRPPPPLSPGEAVRVMTGAPIPAGTEAIVPVEDVRRENDRICPASVPRAGEHVRRRGESIAAGVPLLARGERLSASGIAVAALAGADPIEVHRRPSIAIAVTGNELVPAASKPGPGQLRDSNGPMLAALCRAAGRPATALPAVADEDGAVARLFAGASRREDVLVTSGGVSAGDLDLLPEQAARSGFEILFHRVAVRPGKPVAFGRRGGALWFGLPGNPVSASVCFHLFVRFALDCLEGAAQPGVSVRPARLTREIVLRGHRETYRDGFLDAAPGGQLQVSPLESLGSHDLAAHTRANVLIRIPADAERLAEGSVVDCLVLER